MDKKCYSISINEKNQKIIAVKPLYSHVIFERLESIQRRKWNNGKKNQELPIKLTIASILQKYFSKKLKFDFYVFQIKLEKRLYLNLYSQSIITNYTIAVKSLYTGPFL